ncbi:MAG: M23 family metallopeptidase [Pyrinomonadaceae bacterium]|nr:M23 family metallopeptidase [Pyrinomonadaceae bacterium]
MQKSNRKYGFLLSYTTKSKLFIRRFEVSKNVVHTGAAGLVLVIGLFSFGFTSFFNGNHNLSAKQTAQKQFLSENQPQNSQSQTFNYDRPDSSDIYTVNSGGPSSDFQLTIESESEESEMEQQLKVIETTSDPSFLPTMWSHLGKINNEYGFRRNPFGGRSYEFHAGMDIDGDRGDIIVAPANGTVVTAGWQGGYGNLIEIDHGNGLTTRYGHLSKIEVQVGDSLQRGQMIGQIGSTGRSTGPHLHYELRLGEKSINPRRFLPPEPTEIKG